ncbi:DUF3870 domain-containing protein [Brevibacillus dissolubilis]|uniref:DUF3870 domain-containing protein n=1 Tax=Brevibacillus dissolubilis TaxID=1844116 RepID=UPI0011161524|nr:DUF3870 domain-containing protein [Brevibacillus dissolubilis]
MNQSVPTYADPKYVLVTGFAQLPKGTPLSENQKVFACALIIDSTDGAVVDASFTFLMGLTEQFLRGLVIGHRLPEDWHKLQESIRTRALVHAQGAIIQALRAAIDRYQEGATTTS